MRAIFRMCGNESLSGLQLVETLATPLSDVWFISAFVYGKCPCASMDVAVWNVVWSEKADEFWDYEIFYLVNFSWMLAYLSEIYLSNWPNIEKS